VVISLISKAQLVHAYLNKHQVSANVDCEISLRFTLRNGSTMGGVGESLYAVNNTDLPHYATDGSGNLSTEYHANLQLRHSVFWTVVIILAYAAVFIVGIVGNAIVICAITFTRQMRTVTNLFILNLAVADMSVVIFCLFPNLLANIFVRKYNSFID
jgi:hypothetical protein